ncbi:MAG: beta-ketoacyl-ACP synthase II, partial [Ignavibacteriales bacterium]|nr:beta-ketoacyl-ACP synthase II [Ignavibacteriales bacterium]
MDRRRVVVTGIGAVTPIGHGKDGLWKGAQSGASGVKIIDRFNTSQIQVKVAAQIDDFDPHNYFDAKLARRMDRFAQLGLAACDMALQDANFAHDPKKQNGRVGVTVGTALGGVAGAERQHETYIKSGLRSVDPSLALMVFGGSGSSNIAIRYGFTGPSNANSNSCSSGTMAIGEAYRYIKDGYADAMIAAGAEAPLYELTFSAFAIIKSMSTNPNPETACRPFDKARDGFVMGEAAAVLVLEELNHAAHRNAHVYCEVLGYSCNNDAHHMVAPRPDAACAVKAMTDCLQEARISPGDLGYVNAHASSTHLNDKVETFAIKSVFGERARQIPVSGTKSMHGHALGASGAVEAALCAQIFEKNFLPPTIHYSNVDPECDLDYVPNAGREATVDYILSNSFGFGGINASL